MQVNLVSLEDGITACGFRKFAAYAQRLNSDTQSFYVSTSPFMGFRKRLFGQFGEEVELTEDDLEHVALTLADADLVGFSSMTGYSDLTRDLIAKVRARNPQAFIVWGGIHSIIHPEDAIAAEVDAICTGEGEFAFEELVDRLRDGRDFTDLHNLWFRRNGDVVRNPFRPLMTVEEMETLPFAQYGESEVLYEPGEGFRPTKASDYLHNSGLGYDAIWSIGCPFHCSFCGNTKFIENDPKYKRVRHPSARYIVEEIKRVRERFPHVNTVKFYDDSFMAIPYREIEEFADLWHDELAIPFSVYGVIPNYVNRDKFELLTWAGMNRVRMGIQSGSQAILDFYKRPTPPEKILTAGGIIAEFKEHHVPPAYDIIVDNPIETRQDVVDTLELLYEMPRPYALFIFSLKVIPNTEMERAMTERGIDVDEISSGYLVIPPRTANLLLYLVAMWKPPRWLWNRLLRRVRASSEPQRLYPRLAAALRLVYFARNAYHYLRFMDFSQIQGRSGWFAWRFGIVGFWRRHFHQLPRQRPERKAARDRIDERGEPTTSTSIQLRPRPG